MASDNQASYSKIGLFLVAGVVLIIGTLMYLGGMGNDKDVFYAETHFKNPVSGLDVGSAVNLRGVRVGSVKKISFIGSEYEDVKNPADLYKIYVLMAFDGKFLKNKDEEERIEYIRGLVEKGLHATVSASGVTGLSKLELNIVKNGIEEEEISWEPEYVVIPPAPSFLQSAGNAAEKILNQINQIDIVSAWTNLVETTSSMNQLMNNLNTLLESQQGNLSEVMDNVRDASSSLREFSDKVKNNPSSLIRSSNPERLDETL